MVRLSLIFIQIRKEIIRLCGEMVNTLKVNCGCDALWSMHDSQGGHFTRVGVLNMYIISYTVQKCINIHPLNWTTIKSTGPEINDNHFRIFHPM